MIPCVAGLFVGVDNYLNLKSQATLLAASASASRLHGYLRSSLDRGTWELLVESAERVPNRSEIIEAITGWARAVKGHNAGLLYFAGHGKLTGEGLVLFPMDIRPAIPYDSGIPLQRVFEIVKKCGSAQAHYVLMIDACRVGKSTSPVIDIPSNVSVIYACQKGGVTAETARSSLFMEFLLRALNESATVPLGPLLTTSLETVVENLRRELSGSADGNYVSLEVSGAHIGSVMLPVFRPQEGDRIKPSYPDCQLTSRPVTAELHDLVLKRTAQCMREMGYPPERVDEYISLVDTAPNVSANGMRKRSVTVRIPLTSRLYPAGALLNLLLSRCPSSFETLSIEWGGYVRRGKFYVITGRKNATLSVQNESLVYVWEEQGCRGQAALSWAGRERTTVELSCFSPEGFRMGLEWLMPTLDDLFDFLVRIPGGE